MDTRTPVQHPVIVTPEQAPALRAFGIDMKVLLDTEATGGALSVLMAWHKPGQGPPDHVHFSQEELFFVLEGIYAVTVGDETAIAGPGTLVFIPRNVVHSFKNITDKTARMLDLTLPGGHDRYFKSVSEIERGGACTGEQMMALNSRHDTHFLTG